jgi:hypothetical protein
MTFGTLRDGRGGASRSRAAFLWTCVTLVFGLFMALLAGCGGGGDGGDDNNNTQPTRVTGTVREYFTNTPVPGATVTYGSQTTVTAGDGTFVLETTSGAYPAQTIRVTPPNNGAYNSTTQLGSSRVPASQGFAVAEVPAGTTRPLGTIYVFSSDYPPLPPL